MVALHASIAKHVIAIGRRGWWRGRLFTSISAFQILVPRGPFHKKDPQLFLTALPRPLSIEWLSRGPQARRLNPQSRFDETCGAKGVDELHILSHDHPRHEGRGVDPMVDVEYQFVRRR